MQVVVSRNHLLAQQASNGKSNSIDLVELKDLDNGFDPFVLATEEITVAMAEAITIAENAYNILNGPLEDQKLTDMVKMVFGDGSDYQTKVDAVKSELLTIGSFDSR